MTVSGTSSSVQSGLCSATTTILSSRRTSIPNIAILTERKYSYNNYNDVKCFINFTRFSWLQIISHQKISNENLPFESVRRNDKFRYTTTPYTA